MLQNAPQKRLRQLGSTIQVFKGPKDSEFGKACLSTIECRCYRVNQKRNFQALYLHGTAS